MHHKRTLARKPRRLPALSWQHHQAGLPIPEAVSGPVGSVQDADDPFPSIEVNDTFDHDADEHFDDQQFASDSDAASGKCRAETYPRVENMY